MSDWEIWAIIGVLCVATAATRSSFWLIGHRVTIPPRGDPEKVVESARSILA